MLKFFHIKGRYRHFDQKKDSSCPSRHFPGRIVTCLLLFLSLCTFLPAQDTCLANALPSLSIEQAVTRALERNPAIRRSVFQSQAQEHRRNAAFRKRLGTLSADYRYEHFRDEPYIAIDLPGFGGHFNAGEQNDIRWGLTYRLPLFTGFALETREALQKSGMDITGAREALARIDIIARTKTAYLAVLLTGQDLETARRMVTRLKAHLHVAESLYGQGMVPYNDVLKAKVALSEASQTVVSLTQDLSTARVRLNLLMGEDDPERVFRLTDNSGDLRKPPIPGLSDLYEIALKNRPEVKILELAVRQAGLKVKLARSTYYPHINLVARYEQHGEDLYASRNRYNNQENMFAGLSVNWLIFDWNRRGQEVMAEKNEQMAIRQQLANLCNRIKLQVRRAWGDLAAAKTNCDTARLAVNQAEEDLRITRLQYSEQMASSTDVIDSEASLTRAENNYHKTIFAFRIALVNLERACGGSLPGRRNRP